MKLMKDNEKKNTSKNTILEDMIVMRNAQPKTNSELVAEMGGAKSSGAEFFKVRGIIGQLFAESWVGIANWMRAAKQNRVMNDDVAAEKFGSYDPEFKRLFEAVQTAFRNVNRNDLANDFAATVGGWDSKRHPVDYIATILKGPANPISRKISQIQYDILNPWRNDMQTALKGRGVAAPEDLDDLTQVFYNSFVATPDAVKNFDQMLPSEMYNVDDAVVNATVSYLKTLADKKKQGEVLPKALDKLASTTIKVENQMKDVATQEVNKEVGGFILGNSKTILIVAGIVVIIVAYLIFRK